MTFKSVLALCDRRSIFNVANGSLRIGPVGALLQENLRREWFLSTVVTRNVPVFVNEGSFADTFRYAKQVCDDVTPFGVAEISESSRNSFATAPIFGEHALADKFVELKSWAFVSPSESAQKFHEFQRQRRAWWRKFSASPGMYMLTDITGDANGNQSVDVKVKHKWGDELLEKLCLRVEPLETLPPKEQLVSENNTKVQLHTITSTISYASMLLNSVCDAYDANPRPLLRLHRKLAPYQISFALESSELRELATYLCLLLRGGGITCLFLPTAATQGAEVHDELGVPYGVVLRKSSLKNGIVFLRSRDTTLEEQVHVTALQGYVCKLFENY